MTSKDFFEPIHKQFQNKLPFVVYRKPNENEVKALQQKDSTLHTTKDFNESGFVFAPFDDSEDAVLIPFEDFRSELVSFENNTSDIEKNTSFPEDKNQKEDHIKLVSKAIDKIQSGNFNKIVVSRKELVRLYDSSPIDVLKRLLKIYPTAFVYSWYHPKVGLWLGASPETLLRTEGSHFTTMALAGTQNYEGTLDIEWGNKEKEEHQLVIDFIVNNLKAFSDEIKTFKTETVRAGHVLHLKTKISGNFSVELKDVLKILHPTPAVCGQPKEMAKQFILENENYNREFYTGFLGELNMKQKINRNSNRKNIENNAYSIVKNVTNLYVNLRCMKIKNKEALIYVGGGITKDSVPENEWQETVSKTLVMKKALL